MDLLSAKVDTTASTDSVVIAVIYAIATCISIDFGIANVDHQ